MPLKRIKSRRVCPRLRHPSAMPWGSFFLLRVPRRRRFVYAAGHARSCAAFLCWFFNNSGSLPAQFILFFMLFATFGLHCRPAVAILLLLILPPCATAPSRTPRLCLSSLRSSRAAKAQGKNFCSRRASSAPQKFILAPHMSLLRIKHGGAAAPPNLPEFSVFQIISVAQLFVIMTSVVNARGCCRLNCNSPCLILSFSPTTTLIPEAPGRRYQG